MKRSETKLLWAGLATALLALAGCGSNNDSSPSSTTAAIECGTGTAGCVCSASSTCNAGLTCNAGVCTPSTCAAGMPGCACMSGNLCNPGGTCVGNVCEDATGSLGHACYSNGTCDPGGKCDAQNVCQTCDLGSKGCACAPDDAGTGNGGCAGGLACVSNVCASSDGRQQNPNMDCFLPCTADLTTPQGTITCDPDEQSLEIPVGTPCPTLVPNQPPQTCIAGACVGATPPPLCASDNNCAKFTTCLGGVCASECRFPGDCPDAYTCFAHACRQQCRTDVAGSCGKGYMCQPNPGDTTGMCMPVSSDTSTDAGAAAAAGNVSLSSTTVVFTKNTPLMTFTITNTGTATHTFTVTKVSDLDYTQPNHATGTPPRPSPSSLGIDGGFNPGDVAMPWLAIGPQGASTVQNSFTIQIAAGGSAVVEVNNAPTSAAPGSAPVPDRWDGTLKVTSDAYGPAIVNLRYSAPVSGHWLGQVYYFESFSDINLDNWITANRPVAVNTALSTSPQNAFINQWQKYRGQNLTLNELHDVLTSTVNETWLNQVTVQNCPTGYCYPTNGPQAVNGLGRYSSADSTTAPIPRGPVKMTMGMDLLQQGNQLVGTINSNDALQYAGSPKITISFTDDPTSCAGSDQDTLDPANPRCRVFAQAMSADILAGARYITNSTDANCSLRTLSDGGAAAPSSDLVLQKTPWLVPGFLHGATQDQGSGLYYTYECRDQTEPLVGNAGVNPGLAAANPIPDGQSRKRHIDLIDGVLYDTNAMMIVFRERFDSGFLGAPAAGASPDPGFAKYGVMVLSLSPAAPTLTVAPPDPIPDTRASSVNLENPHVCDGVIAAAVSPSIATTISQMQPAQVDALFITLVDGTPFGVSQCAAPPAGSVYAASQVHYLCTATNTFDTSETCADSAATFFAYYSATAPAVNLAADPCNTLAQGGPGSGKGTCDQKLQQLEQLGLVDMNPVWSCTTDGGVVCDNIADLRLNKTFGPSAANADGGVIATNRVYDPLQTDINDAFRYKSQFASRDGTNVGFAPSICIPDSDAVPYCYDPKQIAALRDRMSCLSYIYSTQYTSLAATPSAAQTACGITVDDRTRAKSLLRQAFSYTHPPDYSKQPTSAPPTQNFGFEPLNAELLIMLGDDAYTRAFEARFDLADSLNASFQGSLLEPHGIDLSGGAGYELYVLYEAAQYYQTTLDRFFTLSPYLWQSITEAGSATTSGRQFVDIDTVESYFTKLTRASTQKSAAWSEIAKKYQQLNQTTLATNVIQREYTATYLESILFGRLLTQLIKAVPGPQLAQLQYTLETTAQSYQQALISMQQVYSSLTDQLTYFGLPAGYVPFPVVNDATGLNAFDTLMTTANSLMQDAANKETLAIDEDKSYETDSTAFQSQLTQIRNDYDNQLSSICGTFKGDDGNVYPAIPKYAPLGSHGANSLNPNGAPRLLGDPCGLVGNGQLNNAIVALSGAQLDAQSVEVQRTNLEAEIQTEISRVQQACAETVSTDNFELMVDNKEVSLTATLNSEKTAESQLEHTIDLTSKLTSLIPCVVGVGGTSCPSSAAAAGILLAAGTAQDLLASQNASAQETTQDQIVALKSQQGQWNLDHACNLMDIDSAAKVSDLMLGFAQLNLDAIKQQQAVHLALSNIQALHNQATQLEQQETNAEQLAINAAAAKDNPNVRIYKNDAIINADASFQAAVQAAYKATVVYEYYTSQSYDKKGDLALIRLIAHGDTNLQDYLRDLQTAYAAFQDNYGAPDVRVVSIDLCTDILKIPYYDTSGAAYSQDQRRHLCRQAVLDPARLDARGYIRIPFSTTAAQLSPVTRDHKILYLESDFFTATAPTNAGDIETEIIAPRIYLTQGGSGLVNGLGGQTNYYTFPERTAVIDSLFDGIASSALTPDVFKNTQLRDRPFIDTNWTLTLNLKDEPANTLVNMNEFDDIQIWIYYTDFTQL